MGTRVWWAEFALWLDQELVGAGPRQGCVPRAPAWAEWGRSGCCCDTELWQYALAPCEPCQEHPRGISGWFWGPAVSPAPSQPHGGVLGPLKGAEGRAARGEEPWRCVWGWLGAGTRWHPLLAGGAAGGEGRRRVSLVSAEDELCSGRLGSSRPPSDDSREAFSEGRSKNCASAARASSFPSGGLFAATPSPPRHHPWPLQPAFGGFLPPALLLPSSSSSSSLQGHGELLAGTKGALHFPWV